MALIFRRSLHLFYLTANFLILNKSGHLKCCYFSLLSLLVHKKGERVEVVTISQKKEAISLRFCRTAQMKSEAQGKKQRFSRYKQSLRSSLVAFWVDRKKKKNSSDTH